MSAEETHKVLYLMALNKNGVISVTTPFPMLHPTTDQLPPLARMNSGNTSVGYSHGIGSQPAAKAAV